jgi:hypothetical protein
MTLLTPTATKSHIPSSRTTSVGPRRLSWTGLTTVRLYRVFKGNVTTAFINFSMSERHASCVLLIVA